MKLALLLVISFVTLSSWKVNGWFVNVEVKTSYDIKCRDCKITLGRKKRQSLVLPSCGTFYPQKFIKYDQDQDKKITLEELAETTNCTKGQLSSVFDNTDINDDGHVDPIEFQFAPFYDGQKDHATLLNLWDVGEWVSDAISYMNKHGKKTVTFEITRRSVRSW